MKLALVALVLLIHPAFAEWKDFRHLVVADDTSARTHSGVRITYLGTNGYLLEASGTTLLIDPYFSRARLGTAVFNTPIRSSPVWVAWGLQQLPKKKIDGILVTHGHFDHLLDAPEIARRTGAKLLASPTSVALAQGAGLPAGQGHAMDYAETYRIGRAKITALAASHDRLFGCCVPFPGEIAVPPQNAPRRPAHWICGEPLAFLIEVDGRRIYVDSGGTSAVLPPPQRRPIDLAIVGVALADSRRRLPQALARLRPRYFLPSHQDDFFRPLDRGFVFGAMTDFPHVQRTAKDFPARLILLDYFQPWTLR